MNELRHSQMRTTAAGRGLKHTSSILALTWHARAADGRPQVTAATTQHYAVKAIGFRCRKASTKPQKCSPFPPTVACELHGAVHARLRLRAASGELFRRVYISPPLQRQRSEQ